MRDNGMKIQSQISCETSWHGCMRFFLFVFWFFLAAWVQRLSRQRIGATWGCNLSEQVQCETWKGVSRVESVCEAVTWDLSQVGRKHKTHLWGWEGDSDEINGWRILLESKNRGRRWQSTSRIRNLKYDKATAIGGDNVKGMAMAVTGCCSVPVTREAQSLCSFSKRRPHMASSDWAFWLWCSDYIFALGVLGKTNKQTNKKTLNGSYFHINH